MAGEDRDHLNFPDTNELWTMTDNQIQRHIERAKDIANYSNSLLTDGSTLDTAFTEYSGSVGIREELSTEIGAISGKWREAQDFINAGNRLCCKVSC